MPKVIVQLSGGLGNQMFQYGFARGLSFRNNAELVLDNWSGFVRDKQYNRKYELGAFPIKAREASLAERLPFWSSRSIAALKIRLGLGNMDPQAEYSMLGCRYVRDENTQFLADVSNLTLPPDVWVSGYWQSPKYFEDCVGLIQSELSPPTPKLEHFLKLGERMSRCASVALGVRLYEESLTPSVHARNGLMKSIEQINQAISDVCSRVPNATFFVFCTHHSDLLDRLSFPSSPTFVTSDDGFDGTIDRLWLLSQCQHHIFTNSSFYWWGAWLGCMRTTDQNHQVFGSDNFLNLDCIPPNWSQF